jgi:hypothetical protein
VAEEIIMRIAEPQDADSLRELIYETLDTCYFRIYPRKQLTTSRIITIRRISLIIYWMGIV